MYTILILLALGIVGALYLFFKAGQNYEKKQIMQQHEKLFFWCCVWISNPAGDLGPLLYVTYYRSNITNKDELESEFIEYLKTKDFTLLQIKSGQMRCYKTFIPTILHKGDYRNKENSI